jgi:rhodanese-related sulfurtransferase
MYKKYVVPFLLLVVSFMMVVGCDKDSPNKPEPINEFNLVAAVGDVYFTSYKTQSGAGVNISIYTTDGTPNVFDILNDGDSSNDPFIIDYRTEADYNDGHIKDAVNIPLSELMNKVADGTIPKDKTILNVCYTGQTSSAATSVLNLLGYEAKSLLFGMCSVDTSISGTDKWLSQIATDEHAGDLVSTASTTTTTHDFPTLSTGKETADEIIMARFSASGWTKPADDVWDNKANYFIINYWPEAEYVAPGHISGAYQFTPQLSLKTTEKLNLLPTDKPIVVYCYTGQTSAQVTTYLRILGYDAYSLLYGTNGFAYNAPGYTKGRYTAPTPGAFDAILVK